MPAGDDVWKKLKDLRRKSHTEIMNTWAETKLARHRAELLSQLNRDRQQQGAPPVSFRLVLTQIAIERADCEAGVKPAVEPLPQRAERYKYAGTIHEITTRGSSSGAAFAAVSQSPESMATLRHNRHRDIGITHTGEHWVIVVGWLPG